MIVTESCDMLEVSQSLPIDVFKVQTVDVAEIRAAVQLGFGHTSCLRHGTTVDWATQVSSSSRGDLCHTQQKRSLGHRAMALPFSLQVSVLNQSIHKASTVSNLFVTF